MMLVLLVALVLLIIDFSLTSFIRFIRVLLSSGDDVGGFGFSKRPVDMRIISIPNSLNGES
jgi:hypothetical protein